MGLLNCSDVGKCFGEKGSPFWAIRHADISFPSKGLFAIKGKSGSGKSTLLNLLAGYFHPDEGKIFYKGKDISTMKGNKLAQFHLHEVTTIFQHYNLIMGSTALFNVALPLQLSKIGKRKAEKRATSLLDEFGLGYLAKKKVDKLSGGEKQRIAICRSLINDPKIVLADEPTGALDEESSKLVMEMLKRISKSKLVVFVSHNDELISSYPEEIIEVKEGTVSRFCLKEDNPISESEKESKGYGKRWTSFFTSRNFRLNWGVNIIMFLSGVVGFSSLLLGLGFFNGASECLDKQQGRSLEFQSARISEKNYINIEGSPLQLVRQLRPDKSNALDALAMFDHATIEDDYSFFFPPYCTYELDGEKQDPCSFLPVYDLSLTEGDPSLIIKGGPPKQNDFSCVIVNEEFASLFSFDVVNKPLRYKNSIDIVLDGTKDTVKYDFTFRVCGVVKEFSFLNAPKVYFSYLGLREKLKGLELPNISKSLAKSVNASNVFAFLPNDHAAANYDYLVFFHRVEEAYLVGDCMSLLKESGSFLSLESSSHSVSEAFRNLTSSFNVSLSVFVVIAFLGVGLIIGMCSYSNFISKKKEAAILFALGSRSGEISNIFVNESVSVALLSALTAILISPYLQKLANRFIESRFDLESLISIPLRRFFNYPFFLEILCLLLAMLIAFLATSIPLRIIKKMPLAEELKDE